MNNIRRVIYIVFAHVSIQCNSLLQLKVFKNNRNPSSIYRVICLLIFTLYTRNRNIPNKYFKIHKNETTLYYTFVMG